MGKIVVDLEWTWLSFSRIKSWRRCQMQHHYRYYQKLRKRVKARPLYLGTAVHTCLENQVEKGHWTIDEIQKEYDKLFSEEKALIGDIPGDTKRIVEGYFRYYKNDGYTYQKVRHGKVTELHVKVDLGDKLAFHGYIDAMPHNRLGYWVMDHKTTKRMPTNDVQFSDLQLVMYVWAAPQDGLPKPTGVLWDYIRTKSPAIPETLKSGGVSKRANIDTTPEVYLETVQKVLGEIPQEYREFAETLQHKWSDFYQRIPLPSPSKALIDNTIKDMIQSGKEIRERGPTSMVRTMTRDCSFCPYFELCAAEVRGLDADSIRARLYEVKDDGTKKEVEGDDEEQLD